MIYVFPHSGRHPSYCATRKSTGVLVDPTSMSVKKMFVAPLRGSFRGLATASVTTVLKRIYLDASRFCGLERHVGRRL